MDVSLYSFFRRIGDEGDAIRQYAENLVQEFSPDGSIKPLDFMPNPWRFYDAYDREVPLVSDDPNIGPGQGFIWPFSEPNARLLLKRIREDENVDIQRLFGVDLNASVFDATPTPQNWSAGLETGYHFGTRRQANALIGADALRVGGLTGDGVNVLVCDQGFDSNYLKALGGKYGGGFGALVGNKIEMPGKGGNPLIPVPAQHGSMMLRTLVDLAPDATYFDLPLLPRRIDDVRSFTLDAILTLNLVNFFLPEKHKPWVIVNAWGVVNRFAEQIRGEYTSNNHHWLNALYRSIGEKRDVVFAAGNNGQFGAEPRVPGYDRGPNESIYGANGAPEVTCVGAVRSDATWIGASSQGRGTLDVDSVGVGEEKPDVCAPSWFVENDNAHLRSGGTSAASAVTAGVIAALRQNWDMQQVSPQTMTTRLREGASLPKSENWNSRLGAGVLDVPATIGLL